MKLLSAVPSIGAKTQTKRWLLDTLSAAVVKYNSLVPDPPALRAWLDKQRETSKHIEQSGKELNVWADEYRRMVIERRYRDFQDVVYEFMPDWYGNVHAFIHDRRHRKLALKPEPLMEPDLSLLKQQFYEFAEEDKARGATMAEMMKAAQVKAGLKFDEELMEVIRSEMEREMAEDPAGSLGDPAQTVAEATTPAPSTMLGVSQLSSVSSAPSYLYPPEAAQLAPSPSPSASSHSSSLGSRRRRGSTSSTVPPSDVQPLTAAPIFQSTPTLPQTPSANTGSSNTLELEPDIAALVQKANIPDLLQKQKLHFYYVDRYGGKLTRPLPEGAESTTPVATAEQGNGERDEDAGTASGSVRAPPWFGGGGSYASIADASPGAPSPITLWSDSSTPGTPLPISASTGGGLGRSANNTRSTSAPTGAVIVHASGHNSSGAEPRLASRPSMRSSGTGDASDSSASEPTSANTPRPRTKLTITGTVPVVTRTEPLGVNDRPIIPGPPGYDAKGRPPPPASLMILPLGASKWEYLVKDTRVSRREWLRPEDVPQERESVEWWECSNWRQAHQPFQPTMGESD
ncbi:hypothetical protein DL93DRAFT_1582693 [Clavulina sp. PMI_390]|nr:hypothetical protein DL93DRAFT_1582693 [Clavulina sp. PMI_390]